MSFFSFLRPFKPRTRGVYAILARERAGEFLLFNKQVEDTYHFIHLPDLYQLKFTKLEFKKSLKGNILEFVEVVPQEVFDTCIANSSETTPVEQKKLEGPDIYDEND